jgi:hypothetical protein
VRTADDARGGRLYDNWRAEKNVASEFVPDDAATPELDGKGGPNGNGTLNDTAGWPLPNSGHDYRLKNLFGWDLRGAEGIYGPSYQNKAYVVSRNLLTDTREPAEIQRWLRDGDAALPALGQVLDDADLTDLATFLVKTRNGQLARPEQLYRLDPASPKHYVLLDGANVNDGKARYAASCVECHGADGRKIAIDDTESVGALARTSGYEIWFKLQNGQPGSGMKRQVLEHTGPENSRAVLELLAALCDRNVFPAMSGSPEVDNGDKRCAGYLR